MSSSFKESVLGVSTFVARSMAPAHVPKIAPPCFANFSIASARPSSRKNCNCVVLSPPGRIKPSQPMSCTGVRTSALSAPSRASIAACASKSPCTAKIPIFTHVLHVFFVGAQHAAPLPPKSKMHDNRSPSARRKHVLLVHLPDIESAHCFAKLFVSFEHSLRVFEMRRRLHDCLRPHFWIAGLEDAGSDEHRFRAQPPHQRRIRRSCNPA